jgi:hypothetical protein
MTANVAKLINLAGKFFVCSQFIDHFSAFNRTAHVTFAVGANK